MDLDLKKTREKFNLTQAEIAAKLGITRELVSLIESGKRPMSKTTKMLLENFNKSEIITNSAHENAGKELPQDAHKFIPSDNQLLQSIAESNRMLAESQIIASESSKILAESQKQLVATNAELVTMYKNNRNATGGSEPDITKDVYAKLDNLLEVIASVAAGERYESKQEALATLGRNFYLSSGS